MSDPILVPSSADNTISGRKSAWSWLISHPIKLNEGNSFTAPWINLAIWAVGVGAVLWYLLKRK